MRWEDNIRERTGLEFDKSQRAVEMEETGCGVICGAPTTLAVKGQVKGEGVLHHHVIWFSGSAWQKTKKFCILW